MKLFELYKQPLREDKTFTASIKLCESVISLLDGMEDLAEARVTDPNALKVKEIATEMFGKPYSSARIANGTVHRISIPIGEFLKKQYRYVPIADIHPNDERTLGQLKAAFMQKVEQDGVDTSLVDIKFHIAAGVYMSVRTKIDETVEEGMNDAGEFEFEPDPAFAGVKGVTRDTGAGEQDRKAAENKKQHAKVNQTWQKLIGNLSKLDFAGSEKLKVSLTTFAKAAKKNGVPLTPSPEEVLG